MTGIELIAKERQEQIEKHGLDTAYDVSFNDGGQLAIAASAIISTVETDLGVVDLMPQDWQEDWCLYMARKPYRERLIIAGALIAAEIDRLHNNLDE